MKVAVIGLGKLGLPLAALLANSENEVLGFDSSISVRDSLKNENFDFNEPQLSILLKTGRSNFTILDSILDVTKEVEVIFIIVPTPSETNGGFSNDYVIDVVNKIGLAIRGKENKIVVDIVSTVMPNSCEGVIRETLETSSERTLGENLGLCYNPEFIALGSVIHDMEYPDMHLIGQSSAWAGALIEKALKSITKRDVPARRMTLTEAELVKIAVNNFVTMKISYANLLYQAALTLGNINIDVVTGAIGLDSRIGGKYLKAAAPYGGPCFPRDTRALSYLYQEMGLINSLSAATDSANRSHVDFLTNFIHSNVQESASIGLVGLSYKTGTQVVEESPGMAIGKKLEKLGHRINFWDDESATPDDLNSKFIQENSLEEVIKSSEYLIVTRPLNNPSQFYALIEKAEKPFIDLWRQQTQ